MEQEVKVMGNDLPTVREYQVRAGLRVVMVPPRLWMRKQDLKPGDWLDMIERPDGVLEIRKRNEQAA